MRDFADVNLGLEYPIVFPGIQKHNAKRFGLGLSTFRAYVKWLESEGFCASLRGKGILLGEVRIEKRPRKYEDGEVIWEPKKVIKWMMNGNRQESKHWAELKSWLLKRPNA